MILNGMRLFNYLILSPGFQCNYNVNDYCSKEDLQITSNRKGTDYVIINFIKPFQLEDLKLQWIGVFDNLKVEVSSNFLTWKTIFEGQLFTEVDKVKEKIVFLKITFEGHNKGFKVIELQPMINEEISTDRFISYRTQHVIPEKFHNNDELILPFIKTCYRMWERGNKVIKFKGTIPEFLISGETFVRGIGGIDTYAIDTIPVDEDWSRIYE